VIIEMSADELKTQDKEKNTGQLMPLLFLGHGSPMNAIEENEFVEGWRNIAKTFPKPKAILCISAHWLTRGTYVSAGDKPETIHDFGGFPKKLYDVQYPAPGSPSLANEIKKVVTKTAIHLDHNRGLDHGCWSVAKSLYPDADIPVVQMSIDSYIGIKFNYDIGKELRPLRSEEVLIIGSGNIVHNLGMIDWQNIKGGHDWAIKANEILIKLINENDYLQLINYHSLGEEVNLSIPTTDHYLPVLYMLALKNEQEKITFFNNKVIMGSLSMTSFIIS
jgi:4,5-DOPA dioxygenase extradiol